MKASRFMSQCSSAVRQGLAGVFVVGSLFLVIQPVQAHGDVKGDTAMPDTSRAAGPVGAGAAADTWAICICLSI